MCLKMTSSSFCKTIDMSDNTLIINGFRLVFYRTAADVRQNIPPQYFSEKPSSRFETSTTVYKNGDLFLNLDYLEALERTPPTDFSFAYLVIQHPITNKIVGFMACQIKDFDASKSLNYNDNTASVYEKIKVKTQKIVARLTRFSTLIIGNLTLTGEHSFYFDGAEINDFDLKKRLYTEGVSFLKKQLLDKYNIKIASVFVKDFYQNSPNYALMQAVKTDGYNEFQVEPNFVFELKTAWKTLDEYMNDLASKYRVRAKRAFKKLGTDVEKKEFFEERIMANQLEINALYAQVSKNSGFNLVDLHTDYFLQMKTDLGDRFRLFGYFLDQKLIGFYTTISNGEELEAHFLGYDASLNHDRQIYLNMLFDLIKLGIECQFKRVIFSRTAHEIKSSVGAEPIEMSLFMKHDNLIVNRLLLTILRILSPREKWTPRTPFK
jgi:hypothetical protein